MSTIRNSRQRRTRVIPVGRRGTEHVEAKERAEKLDERIEKTDRFIDEVVYALYGLTKEEIEIVEQAVGD